MKIALCAFFIVVVWTPLFSEAKPILDQSGNPTGLFSVSREDLIVCISDHDAMLLYRDKWTSELNRTARLEKELESSKNLLFIVLGVSAGLLTLLTAGGIFLW
jgi:hypothetical protein